MGQILALCKVLTTCYPTGNWSKLITKDCFAFLPVLQLFGHPQTLKFKKNFGTFFVVGIFNEICFDLTVGRSEAESG